MPFYRKYNVVILGFDGALASAITGALDIFSFTGVSWQRIHGEEPEPRFEVVLASLHKQPVQCSNRLVLVPHADINEVKNIDILLVPTIGGKVEDVLDTNKALLPIIQKFSKLKTDIASNCSGAFLLAEAGILNDCKATTHWGYADLFKARYPDVELEITEMITQSHQVFCAGGGVAFNDLCLMLIERYCGHEVANQVAKAHVINRQSDFQATYANLLSFKHHNHTQTARVQEYIEAHFADDIDASELTTIAQCTERTLRRNFKRYVGLSPAKYLQSVRIENAKRLLEQGAISTQNLANEVGYEDNASFGRLFKKLTGFTPGKYRLNFQRNFAN